MEHVQIDYIHWNPLLFVSIFIVIGIIIWLVGKLIFRSDYHNLTEQSLPFYSGTSSNNLHLMSASNLYWGFKHVLEPYFHILKQLFISDLLDFIQWFIIITAALLLLITGVVF